LGVRKSIQFAKRPAPFIPSFFFGTTGGKIKEGHQLTHVHMENDC